MNRAKLAAIGAAALAAGCVVGAVFPGGTTQAAAPAPIVVAPAAPAETQFGDPLGGAPYWFQQSHNDCAEASAVILYGELTGQTWSEAHMISRASSVGVPGGGVNGTPVDDIPKLYASLGLSATSAYASSLPSVEDVLDAGGKILALVDAEKLWAADGYRTKDGGRLDHVLIVDSVDTARGLVTLTDTGIPAGATETVSIAVFGAAWAASGDGVIAVSA